MTAELRRTALAWLAPLVATLVLVCVQAWNALLVIVLEGGYVLALLAAAAGWGWWPAGRLLRNGTAAQRAMLALALGLGIVAALAVGLGLVGALHGATAWGLIGGGVVLGAASIGVDRARGSATPGGVAVRAGGADPAADRAIFRRSLVLLPLAVPLSILILGVCLPPGILWPDEANGYDVLEYHLQVPREYFESGRIAFLPHNVYASFPQQVETLYLILMHLRGDPHTASLPSQMMHGVLGILAVVAVAAWSPAGAARQAAILLCGGVVWIGYLGCLAYVENGVLFLAAVAAGLVFGRPAAGPECTEPGVREMLAAGLCAGLCGGCKYTALALVAAGLGVAWAVTSRMGIGARARRLSVFAAGVMLAFGPWLARNAALAGNPVYPFAYAWFGGAAWSVEQDEQWRRGHRLCWSDDGPRGRWEVAARELLDWDETKPTIAARVLQSIGTRFNVLVFVAAVLGCARSLRDESTRGLLVWTVWMLAIWAIATHMPARFVVALAIPLVMMAVRSTSAATRRLALAAALLGALGFYGRWSNRAADWRETTGSRMLAMLDQVEAQARQWPLAARIPKESRAWLVGDAAVFWVRAPIHYTTVFNRDPWIEHAAAGATADESVAWLAQRGWTHVVFNWDEIERLRSTYGFPAIVTKSWVDELVAAGLRCVHPTVGATDDFAIFVYAVPRPDGPE